VKLLDLLFLTHTETVEQKSLCSAHNISVCDTDRELHTHVYCHNCPLSAGKQARSANLPQTHILDEMTGREP
jgi:hypothetical protein